MCDDQRRCVGKQCSLEDELGISDHAGYASLPDEPVGDDLVLTVEAQDAEAFGIFQRVPVPNASKEGSHVAAAGGLGKWDACGPVACLYFADVCERSFHDSLADFSLLALED